jgi:hypothetical protein
MGIRLTPEEERGLAPVVKPCYAALGLANDYFSFDVEWQEFQSASSGKRTMTNLVWLFMQWDQVDVEEAKRRVREVTNRSEDEYRQRMEGFLAKEGRGNDKLKTYLNALGHQIPGNMAWSLRCPRYHPELCDDASALIERYRKESKREEKDQKNHDIPADDSARRPSDSDVSCSVRSSIWSVSKRSSISSAPSDDSEPWSLEQVKLGDEVRILFTISFQLFSLKSSVACKRSLTCTSIYWPLQSTSALCLPKVSGKHSSMLSMYGSCFPIALVRS